MRERTTVRVPNLMVLLEDGATTWRGGLVNDNVGDAASAGGGGKVAGEEKYRSRGLHNRPTTNL